MDLSRGPLDLSNGQRYMLDGSEVPLIDLNAAIALLPAYAQGDDQGAMRDILLTVIRALANKVWVDIGSNQNGVQSPRFSDDDMLAVWGGLRGMRPYVGETSPLYRTRLLSSPGGITPNAIKSAVYAIAAQFGAKVAFQEPATDGQFWTDDDPTSEAWCSFWQPDNGIYWNYDPTVMNQTNGGYWAPDQYGATFWVIIQLGAGSEDRTPHWLSDDPTVPSSEYDDPQDFWADDVNDYGFWGFDGDPFEVQLVATIEALKAYAVTWLLIEDPNLNGAF